MRLEVNAPAPALFLVFLVLKLTDHIDWSWWWVTAPLWIPASVLVLGLTVALIATWRERC